MQGCLALRGGVLYVGRHEKTAHVRPYDLDGRPLSQGFSFRGPAGAPASIGGLDVDEDHHVWVGDRMAERVRGFTLFGRESSSFGGLPEGAGEPRGALSQLVDLALLPAEAHREGEAALLVARAGWRRHAVQLFGTDGRWMASLRSRGEALGRFEDVSAVASSGRITYVCERGAGRVQVFRDGEFHFLFSVPAARGCRFQPVAVAPLRDGRMVLACGGEDSGLLLVDAAGRLIRTLAESGMADGRVLEPNDVVAEEGRDERDLRVAAIDRDAERVQVFTLAGRCYGELAELPGRAL